MVQRAYGHFHQEDGTAKLNAAHNHLPLPLTISAESTAAAVSPSGAVISSARDVADTLLSLPQINADPVRRALDDAVASALGLDGEMVASARRQLGMEPSVTGRRYGE